MLGNEEASIRVWNKYIDNPYGFEPDGIVITPGGSWKIAYDIED